MSDTQPAYDAFVSYAEPDKAAAETIVASLEARGLKCWIAPRDVPEGGKYAAEILSGIERSGAFILVLSPGAKASKFVCKEVERAVSKGKPIYTIRVRDVELSGELEFFLSDTQWVNATSGDLSARMAPLAKKLLDRHEGAPPKPAKKRGGRRTKASGKPLPAPGPIPDPAPDPNPRTLRWPLLAGLLVLAALVVAVVAGRDHFGAQAAPRWTFDNKPFYLGEDVPLAWAYEPPKPGMSLRYELESARDEEFEADRRAAICTDANPYFAGDFNETRFWRVRAVEDCVKKMPVSDWSEPVAVTQYESVYDRIKATGKVNVYVSSSQDQDVFKWGDHGFDIKLAKLILRDLSLRMDHPVSVAWRSVPWPALLPNAGDGTADFVISSITKKSERERKFHIVFSESYFCTSHALIHRAGLPGGTIAEMIKGKKVGVQGDTTNAVLAEALAEGGAFQVVISPNTETLKNSLLSGQIDFAITDTSFARSAQLDARLDNGMDRLEIKELELSDMPGSLKDEHKQEYGVAVRAGELGLLAAINETIAKAKQDGTMAALYKAATEEYEMAKNYRPGSRSLGAQPWECPTHTAGAPADD